MSIGGIGSGHSAHLSQILSTLFQRLDGASGSGDTDSPSSSSSTSPPASNAPATGASNDAVGRLSDEILALLVQLQQAASGSGAGGCGTGCGGDAGSTAATGQSDQSPIQQLFSAIDANGDGAVTKSEFEGYLTKNGATQQEADTVFAQLDPTGTGSITENQLADAVKAGGHHHGHHHHGIGQAADNLFSQIDGNGDGSITQQELESFITQKGGTTAEADQDFAALDPNNTGAVSKSQFEQAFQPLGVSRFASVAQTSGSDGTGVQSPLVDMMGKITLTPLDLSATFRPLALPPDLRVSLFDRLDSNGDGAITQAEVEKGVTTGGGTTTAANALYAQLDPQGSGSVSKDQFAQNLWPDSNRLFDWSRSNIAGGSAQDAIAALLQTPLNSQSV